MRPDASENVLVARAGLPLRALGAGAGGKALEALTLAGLVILVPRALGAPDYGAFAVALAVSTGIATATGVGGPALFARLLGPLDGGERQAVARGLLRRVGAVRCALVVALAAAAGLATTIAPGSVSAPQLAWLTAAVACGAAATLLAQVALGLERMTVWTLRYPLENGVIVVGALALYPAFGVDGAIAAIALGAAAALVLGLASLRGALGDASAAPVPRVALRFARLQAAGGALTQIVHRGAAPACGLLGVGAAATGHAAIATGAALALTYAVMQTTLGVLPATARTFAIDRQRAEAALRYAAGLAALVVVPCCALIALLAEPLLVAGLGEEFRAAAPALRIALLAAALAPLWALATQLAALRTRPGAVVVGAGAGAAAFVAVAALALADGGAAEAALAMVVGVS